MFGVSKAHWQVAVVGLAAYAVVFFVQKKVMPIPVVGPYLPGGQ